MKTFKRIDAWTSLFLLVGFGLSSLVSFSSYVLLIGYFVVGGWQVVSMLVHALNRWFITKANFRYGYHWCVAILIMIFLLAYGLHIYEVCMLILGLLLLFAPFMAILYTSLCFEELKKISVRPLDALK